MSIKEKVLNIVHARIGEGYPCHEALEITAKSIDLSLSELKDLLKEWNVSIPIRESKRDPLEGYRDKEPTEEMRMRIIEEKYINDLAGH